MSLLVRNGGSVDNMINHNWNISVSRREFCEVRVEGGGGMVRAAQCDAISTILLGVEHITNVEG